MIVDAFGDINDYFESPNRINLSRSEGGKKHTARDAIALNFRISRCTIYGHGVTANGNFDVQSRGMDLIIAGIFAD